MKKILCLCLVLALLPICGMAEIVSLDEQVDQIFRDAKTVGGAFLVARNGEIVYERYYGEQQKTTHVPVTEKSYFRCASVTKLVTGIGLMKMMDDGLLDPDEDISAYLGYAVGNPRYPDTPITLRMLMSHTAGLNENSSYSSKSSKLSDMIALDKKAASNFKEVRPGSQYAYSNFGAGITGAIIESVTGKDVSTFMREYLFAPLGIDAAYSATQLDEAEAYLTATYHKDGSLYRAPSYILRQPYDAFATPDTHYRITVGSLLIRPRDLTRLGIALCGDGTVDGVRVNVVCPLAMTESLEQWRDAYPDLFAKTIQGIPLGRFADPEKDIGRVCVFLASDDASYVTGETITLQGGSGLRP